MTTHISTKELTAADVISYQPDKDLVPLILANSNYSLQFGQTTSQEYNFHTLQKQIETRFIKGKTLIRPQV